MRDPFRRSSSHRSTEEVSERTNMAEIYMQPTASESFDEEDPNDSGLQIPSHYRSQQPMSPSRRLNNEDRLLVLAKHPNATEHQYWHTVL